MAKNKLCTLMKSADVYGHPIGVQYRGNGSFQTGMGAFCTLLTYSLILWNLTSLLIEFSDKSKQIETVTSTIVDNFITDDYYFSDMNMSF